jgi:uncharacterized ion transporter superfamily protein YfcC
MLYFSIIVYTAFGLMCLWFVISGVRKINQEKQNQQSVAAEKSCQKEQQELDQQEQETTPNEETLSD